MSKQLSEMTLEELWELFPVILIEHKSCWKHWFMEETNLLQRNLPKEQTVRISHIGSTAVEGIWAKPTIDILVEISGDENLIRLKKPIEECGYICMAESEERIDFNKGYTDRGFSERVFHLHLRHEGDNDELYFRDYLNFDACAAQEYEQLKLELWKRYEHNRDAYTMCKGNFVRQYTQKGKLLFAGRYDRK